MDNRDSAPVEVIAATLQAFVAGSGALRAVALLDRGPAIEPVLVDCPADAAVEVTEQGRTRELAPGASVAGLDLAGVRRLPAMEVDPATGTVVGTIGGLEYLAEAVQRLAVALGGRSVATVEFQTSDVEAPLSLAARPGEPVIVGIAGRQFALPGSAGAQGPGEP